jgi:predicted 3-demethylubiquinone-9 3-methyltransferase (glyoxalase superfamily)
MQKITPFLWFDKNAEEAMNYYVSTFNDSPFKKMESKIVSIQYYPTNVEEEHMKGMDGKVLTGIFELEEQRFMCLDGGPIFTFNESTSFYIECDGQEEVDYFWSRLSAVPESEQCGWCKDKFGLSWQIIPKQLGELIGKDPTGNVLKAMLQMHKIDISELEKAAQ